MVHVRRHLEGRAFARIVTADHRQIASKLAVIEDQVVSRLIV